MSSISTDGRMRGFLFRVVLAIASVTLCTAALASDRQRSPDPRIQQFEHGLLPHALAV